MSSEATVKKRSKAKKVVTDDEGRVVPKEVSAETPVKKTRTRKTPVKIAEAAEIDTPTVEAPTTKKSRETKKSASPKTTTTSKRSAKTIPLEAASTNIQTSEILKEAKAFTAQKGDVDKAMVDGPPTPGNTEGAILEASTDSTTTSNPGPLASAASAPPVKSSSFLTSFFSDPEPAPVPVPGQQNREPEPKAPTKTRELKQPKTHDFEDSILTSQGKVKAPQQPSQSSTPTLDPPPPPPTAAMSSAQLRAFTTSSFAALKSSSKSPLKPSSSKPASPATAPAPSTTPSPKAPKPPNPPSQHLTPPPAPTSAPPPSRIPSRLPNNPRSLPITPPTPPPPRPTQLPYDQLAKNPQYRRLKWKWTRTMVAIPFAIWTTYELWKRWDRGDFADGQGAGWIARQRPKGMEGKDLGAALGEVLGARKAHESEGGRGSGTTEWNGVEGGQRAGSATRMDGADVDAEATFRNSELPRQPEIAQGVHIEFPVPGAGAGTRADQFASGSGKGWVQVFK